MEPEEVPEPTGHPLTQVLAAAGVELADGLQISFYGRLESVPAFGKLRLLAHDVDARVDVGAATLRRHQLLENLQRDGELTAQRSLPPPANIRRLGLRRGLVQDPVAARCNVFGASAPVHDL